MKRWRWFSFALLAALVAVTVVVVPRFMGNTKHAEAQQGPRLELDMDVTDGTGGFPCNPVTTTVSHDVSEVGNYKVAICLTGVSGEPNAFNFDLVYDDSLNECMPGATHEDPDNPGSFLPCAETDSKCLDYNPDANAGVTIFPITSGGKGLGQNMYDCSASGVAPPACDQNTTGNPGPGLGRAYIGCFATGTATLPIGTTVSAPLAEVEFHAIAGGVDNLRLENVNAAKTDGTKMVKCIGNLACDAGTKYGGEDDKSGNTPGPTQPPVPATETTAPTATSMPRCGLEGLPTCVPTAKPWTSTPSPGPSETATAAPSGGGGGGGGNPPPPAAPEGGTGPVVLPPSTGEGSGGASWATGLVELMAGLGAISLVSGGLYLRRARMR